MIMILTIIVTHIITITNDNHVNSTNDDTNKHNDANPSPPGLYNIQVDYTISIIHYIVYRVWYSIS